MSTAEAFVQRQHNVVWAPQAGSQVQFMTVPEAVFEALLHGNRGGGKTDALIMDFAQHVDQGFGAEWRGILFRQTFPQLSDVIAKSKKWFKLIWGDRVTFNEGQHFWRWDTGEQLFFRQFMRDSDYWNYHGHAYPWIAWEELCNWPDLGGYKRMMSCCRSTRKGMPRKYRATTNPYGPGHNVVKFRFRLPGMDGRIIWDSRDDNGELEPARVAIKSSLVENRALTDADPGYRQRILAAARNTAERKAWDSGDWNIVAGGMFDDVFHPAYNIVPRFEVPRSWMIDRAYDWGSSKPFSVGWWAQSDGSDLLLNDTRVMSTIRGDLFRVGEWYGWNGKPNEGLGISNVDIAQGIVERELKMGWREARRCRVKPGPADTMIFNTEAGKLSVADEMMKAVRVNGVLYPGPQFTRADKSPGSRKPGWDLVRQYLRNVRGQFVKGRDGEPLLRPDLTEVCLPRERPGLFITEGCEQWLRCVPVLPRDDKDLDDVNSDAEDHNGDETRYRVRSSGGVAKSGRAVGVG